MKKVINSFYYSICMLLLYFSFENNDESYTELERLSSNILGTKTKRNSLWKNRVLAESFISTDDESDTEGIIKNVEENEEESSTMEYPMEPMEILKPSVEVVERGKVEKIENTYNAFFLEKSIFPVLNHLNDPIQLMKHAVNKILNPNHYNLVRYMHRYNGFASNELSKQHATLTYIYFYLSGSITVHIREILPFHVQQELEDVWLLIRPLSIESFLNDEELNDVLSLDSNEWRRHMNIESILRSNQVNILIPKIQDFMDYYENICILYNTFGIKYVSSILPNRLFKFDIWNKLYTKSNLQKILNEIDNLFANLNLIRHSSMNGKLIDFKICIESIELVKKKVNKVLDEKIKGFYKYLHRDYNGFFGGCIAIILYILRKAEDTNRMHMESSFNTTLNLEVENELKRKMIQLLSRESRSINGSMLELRNYLKKYFNIDFDNNEELKRLSYRILSFKKIDEILILFEEITTGMFDLNYFTRIGNILSSAKSELQSYMKTIPREKDGDFASVGDDMNLFFTSRRMNECYKSFLQLKILFLKLMHHDERIQNATSDLESIHSYGKKAKAKLKILKLIKEKINTLNDRNYNSIEEKNKLEKDIVVLLFIAKTKY